ncbi:MAG: hypothetical protein D3908_12765 [Candidatus Electrothrix sp. AUS4]|nr:hypothetical protein [Candidatus Electrothrix sp. AUS4]
MLSRKLLLRANERLEYLDTSPLDLEGNDTNGIYNTIILVNFTIGDIYDFYFHRKNILEFYYSISGHRIGIVPKLLNYEDLNSQQKNIYKYLNGVNLLHNKKYDNCYHYFNEITLNKGDKINDYIFLMKARCIFWNVFHNKFTLINREDIKEGWPSDDVFLLEDIKKNIKRESIKNDIDYYIMKIKKIFGMSI